MSEERKLIIVTAPWAYSLCSACGFTFEPERAACPYDGSRLLVVSVPLLPRKVNRDAP